MTKQEIIKMVASMKEEIGNKNINQIFDDKSPNKLGTSQFRELATLCNNKDVQCYDEIELLVKYNIAKDTYGNSWAYKCNNQKVGDIIVNHMIQVKNANQNDENTLKDLSLFFGYLFWQSKVWIMETPQNNNNKK